MYMCWHMYLGVPKNEEELDEDNCNCRFLKHHPHPFLELFPLQNGLGFTFAWPEGARETATDRMM